MRTRALFACFALIAAPGLAETAGGGTGDADALADAIYGAGCVMLPDNAETIGERAGLSNAQRATALAVLVEDGRAEMAYDDMAILTSPDCRFAGAETLAAAVEANGCVVGEADGERILAGTGLDRRTTTLAVRVLVWQGRAKTEGGTLTLISGGCA